MGRAPPPARPSGRPRPCIAPCSLSSERPKRERKADKRCGVIAWRGVGRGVGRRLGSLGKIVVCVIVGGGRWRVGAFVGQGLGPREREIVRRVESIELRSDTEPFRQFELELDFHLIALNCIRPPLSPPPHHRHLRHHLLAPPAVTTTTTHTPLLHCHPRTHRSYPPAPSP